MKGDVPTSCFKNVVHKMYRYTPKQDDVVAVKPEPFILMKICYTIIKLANQTTQIYTVQYIPFLVVIGRFFLLLPFLHMPRLKMDLGVF